MEAALQIVGKNPATLAASGRFGPFKPESERSVREVNVVSSPTIEAMKKAWAECSTPRQYHCGESYGEMIDRTKTVKYSAKDVEAFSLALVESHGEDNFPTKAGLFLSALIHNCRKEVFVIHTTHLAEGIYAFGYDNGKIVTVYGNVSDNLGMGMKGGRITVNGNAGNIVGGAMNGGSIIINGEAGGDVGALMKSGRIHLNGGFRNISEIITGGKIYHKGRLMVDK